MSTPAPAPAPAAAPASKAPTPAPAPASAASGAAAAAPASSGATGKSSSGAGTTKTSKPKKKSAPKKAGATKAKPKKSSSTGGGGGTSKARKKPSQKKDSVSHEAIFADAAAAKLELEKQRAKAAAKRNDPLWYRIEDVVTASALEPPSFMASSSILPEQFQIVDKALSYAGLSRSDVTPQAVSCLLEQARRYAQELINNAQDYAYMANRQEIASQDLILAKELRPEQSSPVTTQLPKLNLVAQQINRAPLPPIPSQCYSGILLPPKHHQLTARTFDIVSGAVVAQKMTQPVPESPLQKRKKVAIGYGASRASRTIPINLKSSTPPTTTTTVRSTSVGNTASGGQTGGEKKSS